MGVIFLMTEILKLYKNIGETPLECLRRFKEGNPDYKEAKMTYLGRLDPMAEGLLLVLVNNTREKEKYLSLDKAYEFEVLWGFETDTYDILGKLTGSKDTMIYHSVPLMPEKLESKMPVILKKISEKKIQSYPPFSSKVFGKDFLQARRANIEAMELPERGIKIFSLEHIHTHAVTGREILKEVLEKIGKVRGDFRQTEILKIWQNVLITRSNDFFLISKFRADVSSGTYIRGLANEMGKILKTSALAYSIKRTRVGNYIL
jgi:tRNA pseudouridine55 synthase